MDSEAIVIELSTPNKAGIILPHNEDKDNKGKEVLMLIMPVMLNT